MENLEKTTTTEYFACRKCKKKMETQKLGGGDNFFGLTSTMSVLYCNNNECEKYGDLTLVGLKVKE